MLPLILLPGLAPVPVPEDGGTALWEVLYESLGFHREADEETGFQLQALCEVLMEPLQRVYDLVRERNGVAAGGTMLDPDNVPEEGLLYLSQYVGAKLLPNMSEEQRRLEIKRPTTWRRGETETIELIVKRELTGTQWITVRPRTPEVGRIYIRTLLSETPNPERLKATLLSDAIPAFQILDYEAITGLGYADLEASKYQTYEELEASPLHSYEELEKALPGEL